jgi:large subunit ribosomal protein L15
MLQLENLTSLVKKRKRVGRGGNRGGTSGKGSKGQKARTGHHGIGINFEGGQMPLVRRLPKRGFKNAMFEKVYHIVNIEDLDSRFNSGDEITKEVLHQVGLIRIKASHKGRFANMVKILGTGELSKKLIVNVDAVSKSAQEAIEKAGGTVHLTREM